MSTNIFLSMLFYPSQCIARLMCPIAASQKTTPVVPVPVQEEDEDTDICPVCDGQCTCHATTTAVRPTLAQIHSIKGPLTMAELSIKYSAAAASAAGPSFLQPRGQGLTPPAPATLPKPSLKIKFTVPQALLAKQKRRLGLGAAPPDTGRRTGTHNKNKSHQGVSTTPGLHKRSPTATGTRTTVVTTKNRTKQKLKTERKQDVVKARPAPLVKRVSSAGRRKKRSSKYEDDDEESSLTSLSDVQMEYPDEYGDGRLYPTFVSASALESFGSGSESGSDSSSDSSPLEGEIEKEEEMFIIGEEKEKARERARMRRELLGDHHHHNHHQNQNQNHNNEWVIHSRKKSVGLSEGEEEMDVDSDDDDDDGSDDEDDEEDEEDGDQDGEGDADPIASAALPGDDTLIDSSTDTRGRRKYVRLGTSWTLSSSSDESAFDADIFFRHLYDSSSTSSDNESTANDVFAGEDSDADTQIAFEEGEGGEMVDAVANVVELESLPFELAESWDGGVVFTNGNAVASGDARGDFGFPFGGGGSGGGGDRIGVGPGIGRGRRGKGKEKATFGFDDFGGDVDMDIEISMSGCSSDGYLEEDGECEGDSFMFDDEDDTFSFTGCGGGSAGGVDDQLFVDDEDEGSGETTDEDLVGADLLPNERAMRLFKLPSPMWGAVGAVDPLSLFARGDDYGRRRGRKKKKGKARDNRKGKKPRELLSPLDILAGRVAFWDSQDDMDLDDEFCSSQEGDWTSLDGSPSNSIPIRKQSRRKTRATSPPTPTPTTPASTVTTSTRTGSRSISSLSGPRKGVFVLPPPPAPVLGEVSVRTNRGFGGETQQKKKAVVVIGEDRKGANVPSPHPRRSARGAGKGANGSGGSVDGASVVCPLFSFL